MMATNRRDSNRIVKVNKRIFNTKLAVFIKSLKAEVAVMKFDPKHPRGALNFLIKAVFSHLF